MQPIENSLPKQPQSQPQQQPQQPQRKPSGEIAAAPPNLRIRGSGQKRGTGRSGSAGAGTGGGGGGGAGGGGGGGGGVGKGGGPGSHRRRQILTGTNVRTSAGGSLDRDEAQEPSRSDAEADEDSKHVAVPPKRGSRRRRELVALQPGDEVSSPNLKYVVKRKLGSGGFGTVYQVLARNRPKGVGTRVFALKTELRGPRSPDRLKIEVAVLSALGSCEDRVKEHFATMVDRGQTKDFVFIVMTLVGPSLQTIREAMLQREYTPSTALRIAIDTLEAIQFLHVEVGYMHRDIKPSNFTVGHRQNYTKIILIDFGIARRLFNKDNIIRLPRKEVKFLGTVRFASRRCHRNEEQGRQGDLESWFYLICDIYNQNVLPWRKVREREVVFALKNDLRENEGKCLLEQLPRDFRDIMLYVDKLGYEDAPDYEFLRGQVEAAAKRVNADLKQTFDWEAFGPPPPVDSQEDQ